MVKTNYPRSDEPFELDEVMFILWNLNVWGSDKEALEQIAGLVERSPNSIKRIFK